MLRRLASPLVLTAVGAAYFVDVFLRWTTTSGVRTTGWDLGVTPLGGVSALGLFLVELTALLGVWRSRTERLLGFYLGAATAILAIGGLVHLHWGGFYSLATHRFAYGAWIALALAIVLLAASGARLRDLLASAR